VEDDPVASPDAKTDIGDDAPGDAASPEPADAPSHDFAGEDDADIPTDPGARPMPTATPPPPPKAQKPPADEGFFGRILSAIKGLFS
jgi:hypothetical protein